MTTLYAQPLDGSEGFEFTDYEEFVEGRANHTAEEYDIQYIDGDNGELFDCLQIEESNLLSWFRDVDHLDDDSNEAVAMRYLYDHESQVLSQAIDARDRVEIFRGNIKAYCIDRLYELYGLGDLPPHYIDEEYLLREAQTQNWYVEIENGVYCINPGQF